MPLGGILKCACGAKMIAGWQLHSPAASTREPRLGIIESQYNLTINHK